MRLFNLLVELKPHKKKPERARAFSSLSVTKATDVILADTRNSVPLKSLLLRFYRPDPRMASVLLHLLSTWLGKLDLGC